MKLHIIENEKTKISLDTTETTISKELERRAIEEARYQCIGPPIILALIDDVEKPLVRSAQIINIGFDRYYAGHSPGNYEETMDAKGLGLFAGFFAGILAFILLIIWAFA